MVLASSVMLLIVHPYGVRIADITQRVRCVPQRVRSSGYGAAAHTHHPPCHAALWHGVRVADAFVQQAPSLPAFGRLLWGEIAKNAPEL